MLHVKKSVYLSSLMIAAMALSACTKNGSMPIFMGGSSFNNNNGGGGGGGNNNTTTFQGIPTTAFQDLGYSYTFNALGAGYTYSLQGAPAWLTIDSTTGKLSGVPGEPATTNNIFILAVKEGSTTTVGPFSIQVKGDALTTSAWHLNNTGQATYSKAGGVAGEDMKVKEALGSGYTGAGIKIGVSDSGLEVNHEDLRDNVSLSTSKNYGGNSPYLGGDPTNNTDTEGDHGTSVSGIIAAKAWNGIGARGIAPEATISGFNFIPYQAKAGVIQDQAAGNYDIYNQSWGSGFSATQTIVYTGLTAAYLAQLKATATTGRNGKGALINRAAGNDYNARRVGATNTFRQRSANSELDNAVPWVVVVAALNATGKKASYSSTGSGIWISGLAGEFGSNTPAMLTTDQTSCAKGYSRTVNITPANSFETGNNGNVGCNYTSIFNGTSSATPSISGVEALILQANPNLTWRDVKHILAKTATKVDPNFVPTRFALDPGTYISEPGWVTNAAGYNFHNWYGFGRANAKAAVDMAKTYNLNFGALNETATNGTWKYNRNVNLAITDNSATGVTDTVNVTEDWVIETIQIEVSATHPLAGEIGIELTAPSGTRSVVMPTNNAIGAANYTGFIFMANTFYGERSAGNWTIRVLDGAAGNTGTFTNWKINVLGHNP